MIIIDTSKVINSKEILKESKIKNNWPIKASKNIFVLKKILQFILLFIILSAIILSLYLLLTLNDLQVNDEIILSNSVINSKTNSLSQYLMTSYQNHLSISSEKSENFSVFSKAKFDIFTLNESFSTEEDNLSLKKYTTVIIINSICFEFDEKKKNCEMHKYLDLTIRNDHNLKQNISLEVIKEAILPICLIEHSETNDILSVSCPKTLSDNLINDIISAFQSIKPNLKKDIKNNELIEKNISNNENINKNEININTFDNKCKNSEEMRNENCEVIQNITTDKIGNMKKNNKILKLETIKNDNNKYYSTFNYSFENIKIKIGDNTNEENFKYNLKIILELIKPLMKTVQTKSNPKNLNRKLDDNKSNHIDAEEVSFFSQTLFGVNIALNIKNDFGLGIKETSKTISNYIRGSKVDLLSYDEASTNIYEILKKFINLSKAGNKLANSLYENIKKILPNLSSGINTNIQKLNKMLYFEDLSSVFDSISAIDYLDSLPYSVVLSSQNLYSSITYLKNNIDDSISYIKNKLKDNISSYIKKSHDLINNIINELNELYNILSSDKNRIIKISSYYLNADNDYPYIDFVSNIQSIIDDYHFEEKNIIEKLLYTMFMNYSIKFVDSLRTINNLLDKIINRLSNKSMSINKGNDNDINEVKNYLSNTKMQVYEIMPTIENILRNGIDIQSNGYFETQQEIDNTKKIYVEISNKINNISNILYNNLLIDTTFDENAKNLKNTFINLLNYIDKSKREKFPLKSNIYLNSYQLFSNMENDFKLEKINILNYIKEENRQYLLLNQQQIDSFINQNKVNLDNIINNIDGVLSELNLYNLDVKYNEMITTTFNSINNVIETNKNLSFEYLNSVYSAGSSHCTQLYLNKVNVYLNSLSEVKNFIQTNLKNYLINKYNDIINTIRNNLMTIKSNSVIKTYQSKLSFTSNHLALIDIIITRFDKYLSINLFNQKYLPIINNFYDNFINIITQYETQIYNYYNPVKVLTYSTSEDYDYYKYRQVCERYCSKKVLGVCVNHKTRCDDYYDGYTSNGNNNHLYLISINFNEYIINFDSLFNSMNSESSKNIISYNNILNSFGNNMNSIKTNILSKSNIYLNGFSQKINNYINNGFCKNITLLTYNYYKNEIQDQLIIEINNIATYWKKVFDEINSNINFNVNKFKYSIKEIGMLAEIYNSIYIQNISYDYFNSIIEQRKNDFNCSIKNYFNIILSKLNKTYSYILDNMPINTDILFNDILNIRNNEIKQHYSNIINQIQSTKNKYLQKQTQLSTIGVTDTNFFNINTNIETKMKNIQTELSSKYTELLKNIDKIKRQSSSESIVSKFYLEYSLNVEETKKIFEPVYKETFIDLQSDVFKSLIGEIIEIDEGKLPNNIKSYIINSNNLITQNFNTEKEKYENILKNKMYQELYTKDNLENKINTIYSNGLRNLDVNSKNKIYGYLNEVLNRIKTHITNEVTRLSNQLTSYNNNYKTIQNRLNGLKTTIYNQFYSTILSVNNNFYSQIVKKFYTNYIDKYLNIYLTQAKKVDIQEYKFLNITIILRNIQIEIIEKYVNEYKYLAMTHINYLNQKNIQQLNELFSFTTIQNTINNEINNIYNNQLLPILKQKAIYNSGDNNVIDYDLSSTIINDINSFQKTKINQALQIINNMKGSKYDIVEDWKIPDFSLVKKEEFFNIQNSFNNFYDKYYSKEKTELNQIIFENLNNDFKILIENFIPSFGKDFYDRIIKYNEIQKIKSFYNNIKYTLKQSINYYIKLCSSYPSILIPEELKTQILSLNNLESLVNTINNNEISLLYKKLDKVFGETRDYFVDKYIYYFKYSSYYKYEFEDNILSIIYKTLDEKSSIFENEYNNLINNHIKNPFVTQYKTILNEQTNYMLRFIQENKNLIKGKLDSLNTFNSNAILLDIENKINGLYNDIDEYYIYNEDFKISDEVKTLLNNYCKTKILPYYQEIKRIVDYSTKNITSQNMEKNVEKIKKDYIYKDFILQSDNIRNILKNSYFNSMKDHLTHSYGTISSQYLINLDKEIANFDNMRILSGLDDVDDSKQKTANLQLDKTFKLLKGTSSEMIEYIENLYLFYMFDEDINKYINDINEQYIYTKNSILNLKYEETIEKQFNQSLEDLKNYIIDYYTKVNTSYYQTKEFIKTSMNEINNLIEECSNVTYEQINNKYIQIKNGFKTVDKKVNKEISLEVDKHIENVNQRSYIIETEIDKYFIEHEMTLDFIYEKGDITIPKVVGKIVNKDHPKRMVIDFYAKYGNVCEIKGRRMTINFNNISMISDFVFDSRENNVSICHHYNFDEYNIRNEKYIIVEHNFIKEFGGIYFVFPSLCTSILSGENVVEVVDTKQRNISKVYNY